MRIFKEPHFLKYDKWLNRQYIFDVSIDSLSHVEYCDKISGFSKYSKFISTYLLKTPVAPGLRPHCDRCDLQIALSRRVVEVCSWCDRHDYIA